MEINSPRFTLRLTTFKNEYFAVLYDSAMILALLDRARKKELKKQVKQEIRQKKIPLLKRGRYTRDFFTAYENRYLAMDREAVLGENNENMEISYDRIEKVRVKPYRTHTTKAHENPPIAGEMTIAAYSEQYHFNHQYKIDDEKIAKIKETFQEKFTLLK